LAPVQLFIILSALAIMPFAWLRGAAPERAVAALLLAAYLSLAHVEHPDKGCVLPALGAEIARADERVRLRTEQQILQLQNTWAEIIGDPQLAWTILAQCLGSLLLARMMASEESRQITGTHIVIDNGETAA
jgi:hypothetical protein